MPNIFYLGMIFSQRIKMHTKHPNLINKRLVKIFLLYLKQLPKYQN
jgi:hypothetical protein